MGSIYDVAKRLADEGNAISVILAAIKSMEEGMPSAKRGKDGSPRCELERVLDPMRAQALLDHRQAKGAKLTAYAAKLLADELAKTGNPADACDLIILKGWQGFNAKWYDKEQSQSRQSYQVRPGNVVEQRRMALAERVRNGFERGDRSGDRVAGASPAGQLSFAGGD